MIVQPPAWLGETVAALRLESGMTRAALAKAAGSTSQTIRNIETNARVPDYRTLSRIATALGTTVGDLFNAATAYARATGAAGPSRES